MKIQKNNETARKNSDQKMNVERNNRCANKELSKTDKNN